MKTIARLASLSAVALLSLGGCNLTYDREGTKFDPPPPVSLDAEPNDSPAAALPLTLGVDAVGTIGADTDVDYWVFTVPAGGLDVRFQTFDTSGAGCAAMDTAIEIRDASNNLLASSNDSSITLSYCEDLGYQLAAGTYYLTISEPYADFANPFDYLIRTTTGPIGGTVTTVSCDHTTSGYCDQVTGTFTFDALHYFQSYCSWSTDAYGVGACPASTFTGYCDAPASYDAYYGSGSALDWIYYASASYPTQADAEASCTGYGGVWVGGSVMGTIACDKSATTGICQTLIGPSSELTAAQSECTTGGGTVLGNCPAGSVAGYCDAGTLSGHPSVLVQQSYYAPNFPSPAEAAASCSGASATWVPATTLSVEPLFPASANGRNWNDWVPGTTYLDATDAPCDPAGTVECIHAGEVRVVKVPGLASCVGLSATDSLGWYAWSCDSSTGTVRLVAQRLRGANVTTFTPEVRLIDLIDTTQIGTATPPWRQNKVTVTYNYGTGVVIVGETPLARWWTNPIAALPASGNLTSAGTIYVADGAFQTAVQVQASKVGITVTPPAVLAPTYAPRAVVDATSKDFLWIEGAFDSSATTYGVLVDDVSYSVLRSIDVTRNSLAIGSGSEGIHVGRGGFNRLRILNVTRHQTGLRLEGSSYNDVRNVEIADCGDGILVEGSASGPSNGNVFRTIAVAANVYDGIYVRNLNGPADDNSFDGVTSSNNGVDGVRFYQTRGNRLANAVTAFNGSDGVILEYSDDAKIAAVTSAGNAQSGVRLRFSNYNVVDNAATLYGRWGLLVENSGFNTVVDLATSAAQQTGVYSSGGAGFMNYFLGSLVLGGNGLPGCACDVPPCSVTTVGYDDNCNTTEFTASSTPPFTTSFVPAPVISDSVNLNYPGSIVTIVDMDAPFDWTGFENVYRTWGPMPMPPPGGPLGCSSPAGRVPTACAAIWSGTATVFDWSLRATDGLLRERLVQPGTGSLPSGDTFMHFGSDSIGTAYLRHAIERGTLTGANGDGLCGSGEPCLFTPNYGAYQGHGNLFYLGAVTGGGLLAPVSLYRYDPATNGY